MSMNMVWTQLDTWIVVTGVLSAMACALLGNYLVLARMSMMGDAISHAVLPGLAVAFLLTGSRDSLTMFIGAAVVGVLTAVFTRWVHRAGNVEESASMGVVFTVLFAVGLVLIVRAADSVDLDPGCVLYGAIEYTPLDTVNVLGLEVPRAARSLAIVFAINGAFVSVFYKELKISTFDPALATTLGISANLMHYLLMTLVAVTTVAAFESVGSILVIAMLIVPGATAHLLTDRLHTMLVLSLIIAAGSAALGHVAAVTMPPLFGFSDTSTAGMMAVTAGAFFTVALLCGPRYGVLGKLVHQLRLTLRIVREDALGLLWRIEEAGAVGHGAQVMPVLRQSTGAGLLTSRLAVAALVRSGKVVRDQGLYRLTPTGRDEARQLVRAHRLWESYLARHMQLPSDHLHASADRLEHLVSGGMRQAIAEDLPEVTSDPHGRPIPPTPQ
jgi:manganese/zinc/iron transport system permease protein